jgi:hypothetical protein
LGRGGGSEAGLTLSAESMFHWCAARTLANGFEPLGSETPCTISNLLRTISGLAQNFGQRVVVAFNQLAFGVDEEQCPVGTHAVASRCGWLVRDIWC